MPFRRRHDRNGIYLTVTRMAAVASRAQPAHGDEMKSHVSEASHRGGRDHHLAGTKRLPSDHLRTPCTVDMFIPARRCSTQARKPESVNLRAFAAVGLTMSHGFPAKSQGSGCFASRHHLPGDSGIGKLFAAIEHGCDKDARIQQR